MLELLEDKNSRCACVCTLLQMYLHILDPGSVRNVLQLLAESGHLGILVLQDSDDVVEQSDVPTEHKATSASV